METKGLNIGSGPQYNGSSAYNGPGGNDKSQSFEQARWTCWWWELG